MPVISSSTEPVLVTGAVDAMCVDIQCIKQDLKRVADCYDTPFITTNYRAKIEGPCISSSMSMSR